MDTAQKGQIIQPGPDHPVNSQNLQKDIASSLSAALGEEIIGTQVAPPLETDPIKSALATQPHPETDWDDFYNGAIKGRPRSDPSKNFLKVLLGRLKKKNPEKEVVPR